ncbi:MAG TPA: NAD(P)/FAD-dependent oxidoreductase, partial [Patescibacteria group bacterium]
SGSGGSVGAHHAASLGKDVAIVERDTIGGECPNYGCVPTKALLYAAKTYESAESAAFYGTRMGGKVSYDYNAVRKWKNFVVSRTGAAQGEKVFEDSDIHVLNGEAKFVSPHEIRIGTRRYSADKFLIATGTDVAIPPIPGLDAAGYVTFREAINFKQLPDSLFILGGGAIGCEFAQVFSSFGVKIHIADFAERLLAKEDEEVSAIVQAIFENRGIKVHTAARVLRISKREGKKVVHYEVAGKEHAAEVDEILVATGKRPMLDLDLERAGVAHDKHGLKVNAYLQTSASHIYAAGDVIGPLMFTHTASYQSYIAANNMFSRSKIKPSYQVIPRCVFLEPEVASVGISEAEAIERGFKIKKGMAAIASLGRANTDNTLDGFVKVITKTDGTLLGASIVSPRAGEMIHELALAMQLKAKASDVAAMVHAYPTYSEAVKYACANIE